ncbi:MAG: DNA-processing protein DprA [Actinomycetota bacterium]|nr:DNA-processing protein DprA [Actinomycetota bacterium]
MRHERELQGPGDHACDRCIARSWLLNRLAGHLEHARGRIEAILALGDDDLIAAVAGPRREQVRHELSRLDPDELRDEFAAAGIETLCRCQRRYPMRLRALATPPAVLHVAGGMTRFLALADEDPVAIVGARRATPYGIEVARSLGRDLARAGVTVVSGMALGIDSAAHSGALAAGAPTVAVLPGAADRSYPASRGALHRQIVACGAAVSELPPGASVWRWSFPARNRIIAALAASTVVVQAGSRSGSLLTAGFARGLGRPVGAVPGQVTSPVAAGPNSLLAHGAYVVRGPQDVLDTLFGAGVRPAMTDRRAEVSAEARALLSAIAAGADTEAALAETGLSAGDGLAALALLELGGYVRRGPGGSYTALP